MEKSCSILVCHHFMRPASKASSESISMSFHCFPGVEHPIAIRFSSEKQAADTFRSEWKTANNRLKLETIRKVASDTTCVRHMRYGAGAILALCTGCITCIRRWHHVQNALSHFDFHGGRIAVTQQPVPAAKTDDLLRFGSI